mgnify:CR=1 FL=1
MKLVQDIARPDRRMRFSTLCGSRLIEAYVSVSITPRADGFSTLCGSRLIEARDEFRRERIACAVSVPSAGRD